MLVKHKLMTASLENNIAHVKSDPKLNISLIYKDCVLIRYTLDFCKLFVIKQHIFFKVAKMHILAFKIANYAKEKM